MHKYRLLKWFSWRTDLSVYGTWMIITADNDLDALYRHANLMTDHIEHLINTYDNDYKPEGILEFRIELTSRSNTKLTEGPTIKRMKS